ncbi:MAG: hypothetical protein U9R57_01335 [Thermodesulfobacteriota bacterium]|nr:hypothetical protein [Thermodesulfobacteriota bacterium]
MARGGRVGDLSRMETNCLVTTGLYRCMRHPMHLALLFSSGLCYAGRISLIYYYNLVDRGITYARNNTVYGKIGGKEKIWYDYTAYEKELPMFTLSRSCLQEPFLKQSKTSYSKTNTGDER